MSCKKCVYGGKNKLFLKLAPFSHKNVRKVGCGCWLIRPGLQMTLEVIPNVFDGVYIKDLSRPVKFLTKNITLSSNKKNRSHCDLWIYGTRFFLISLSWFWLTTWNWYGQALWLHGGAWTSFNPPPNTHTHTHLYSHSSPALAPPFYSRLISQNTKHCCLISWMASGSVCVCQSERDGYTMVCSYVVMTKLSFCNCNFVSSHIQQDQEHECYSLWLRFFIINNCYYVKHYCNIML